MTCGCNTSPAAANACPVQFSVPEDVDDEGGACSNPFIVAVIGSMRAALPRIDDAGEGRENCPASDVATITLPGDNSKQWQLTLRIRGAAEFNTYPGATFEQGRVATGGATDGNDTWRLQIDSPAKDVWINGLEPVGPAPSNDISQWDYEYQVLADGGSTITLSAGSSGTQLANVDRLPEPQLPPEPIAPWPTFFSGQFLQIDCVAAVLNP